MEKSTEFQVYLCPGCDCDNGVIISPKGEVVCRWCRKPWVKTGVIYYQKQHFNPPYGMTLKEERELRKQHALRVLAGK
jgi:hypothetical protein